MIKKLLDTLQERIPYWLPAPIFATIIVLVFTTAIDSTIGTRFSRFAFLILAGIWLWNFLKSPGSSYLRIKNPDSVNYIVIPAGIPAGPILICALSAVILAVTFLPLTIFPGLWAAYLAFNALSRRRTLIVLGPQEIKAGSNSYRYDEIAGFSVLGKSGGDPIYMEQNRSWLSGVFDFTAIINMANSSAMNERSNYLCVIEKRDGKNQKIAFGLSMPNGEYLIDQIQKDIDDIKSKDLSTRQ